MSKRVVTIVVALFILGLPSAALAHYIAAEESLWTNGDLDVVGRAEISHGNGGGYAKSTVTAWRDDRRAHVNLDPGRLAARNVLYVYTNGQWAICVNGSWNYNGQRTYQLNKQSYYNLPCGRDRNYGDNGGAFADFGQGWKGGYKWSGYHKLP